ncbi:Hypothetical predicted protein, partial [Olea europaea subsp. europaea]
MEAKAMKNRVIIVVAMVVGFLILALGTVECHCGIEMPNCTPAKCTNACKLVQHEKFKSASCVVPPAGNYCLCL